MQPGFYQREGIWIPAGAIKHRVEDYPEEGFETIHRMAEKHFWYRARHRFLFEQLTRHVRGNYMELKVLDAGGGTGAWAKYLWNHGFRPMRFALGDSSLVALRIARRELPPKIECYQIDIMQPIWHAEWDIIFCLDVLEHLDQPELALDNLRRAVRPNGILIITVPAMPVLWSWVDEYDRHKRRYSRRDLFELAKSRALNVLDLRYFMFSLVPLVWLARVRNAHRARRATPVELAEMAQRHHRVPPWFINETLNALLVLEVMLNRWVSFPCGTSLAAVLTPGKLISPNDLQAG
jgi:2-polyprenyl-3-methyl-5-hydroxy-6-metoxy-1,4-benzoquinol methylase